MNRNFWGLVLIVLGVIYLLPYFGVTTIPLAFWPTFWVVVGASIIWRSLKGPSWFGLALGLWIGGSGFFTILHTAGLSAISGRDILSMAWPLLLIGVGVSFLLGKRTFQVFRMSTVSHGSNLGDLHYGQDPWRLDGDLTLEHGAGDLKLDLTTADITEGTHQIVVNVGMGEAVIRVPDSINLSVDAQVNMGELEILGEHQSGGGLSLRKRVIVPDSGVEVLLDVTVRMGSILVVAGPGPA